MLCDAGMLLVPQRIGTGSSELTEIDRQRVNRHLIYTLAL